MRLIFADSEGDSTVEGPQREVTFASWYWVWTTNFSAPLFIACSSKHLYLQTIRGGAMGHFALTVHHVRQQGVQAPPVAAHHGIHCSGLLCSNIVEHGRICRLCKKIATHVLLSKRHPIPHQESKAHWERRFFRETRTNRKEVWNRCRPRSPSSPSLDSWSIRAHNVHFRV